MLSIVSYIEESFLSPVWRDRLQKWGTIGGGLAALGAGAYYTHSNMSNDAKNYTDRADYFKKQYDDAVSKGYNSDSLEKEQLEYERLKSLSTAGNQPQLYQQVIDQGKKVDDVRNTLKTQKSAKENYNALADGAEKGLYNSLSEWMGRSKPLEKIQDRTPQQIQQPAVVK